MEKPSNALSENKMGTMPLSKLLANMAIPMVLAMVVQALYNVVDSIYVSRISETDSEVTALSLAFPVQNIMIGFATGIGVGVNSVLSKSLGEGNQENANRSAGNGIVLVSIVTVVFMLFGMFATRPFFEIQSNVEATVNGGTEYLSICSVFSLGIFVEVLGERLLQASGRTGYTLITQGSGAVANILLDPVFIFGFEPLGIPAMGMAGAAVATVIGQWLAAILAVIFNFKSNPDVQFGIRYLKLKKETLMPILTVGVPSVVMVAIGSVMNFSMNQILQGFSETATSVFGIYFKLQSFFFMPLFGINNATISIMAYNFGARNPKRIMGTLKRAAVTAMAIMVLGLLAFQLLPDLLMGMFNPTDEFLRIGRQALRTISWAFPLAAIGISVSASFQALGNGIYSTIVSLCRQLLVLLPAAYLLSLSGEVTRVWWAYPIAEVVSAIVTVLLFVRIYNQKIKPLWE
ncbi:MAG: MATE family efflux transporter [Ruminococcaceae bacterium]|nr:MATE family efflux transporter [Oscillospiraceae bacterium]